MNRSLEGRSPSKHSLQVTIYKLQLLCRSIFYRESTRMTPKLVQQAGAVRENFGSFLREISLGLA